MKVKSISNPIIYAYGGVAASYINATPLGEPYGDGKSQYILINHNGKEKEVRWYNDEKHHNMSKWHSSRRIPLYKYFFFKDENDFIRVVKDKYNQSEYTREYDARWIAAGWQYKNVLGGAWIAPKEAKVPQGIRMQSEVSDWKTIQRYSSIPSKTGYVKNEEGLWYEQEHI